MQKGYTGRGRIVATTNKRINLQETKLRLTHYKFIACNSISLFENSPKYLRRYVMAFIYDNIAILLISILSRTKTDRERNKQTIVEISAILIMIVLSKSEFIVRILLRFQEKTNNKFYLEIRLSFSRKTMSKTT